ncbi:DUF3006 domain-containing protein (plasmid) [Deinococcus taeanensis]|uniref:DUF3006 domain-containing protein n=1 Tax=Deinococcus taeanensis TaxID=2737050 RepID=UPI001CDC744F|nr:DUF3006 domain-containing protein [Deinococcus taeanensis]UBV45182.1 DUF3006 domain-containing protein [Deinococcus taeanensis]
MPSAPGEAAPQFTHVTIDGIEGAFARVELADGTLADWRLEELPVGVKEGDVLEVRLRGGERHVRVDRGETRRRKASARQALTALNEGAPTGEIDL